MNIVLYTVMWMKEKAVLLINSIVACVALIKLADVD